MASMFSSPPPRTGNYPKRKDDPELAKAILNRERLRSSHKSFESTVVGSGLKTSTGA